MISSSTHQGAANTTVEAAPRETWDVWDGRASLTSPQVFVPALFVSRDLSWWVESSKWRPGKFPPAVLWKYVLTVNTARPRRPRGM